MLRKSGWILCALLGIALWVAGCGNAQKEATDAAINAAQAAINAVQGEAEKYVPDQLQAAQAALQTAKDELAKGEYQAALTGGAGGGKQGERTGCSSSREKGRMDKGVGRPERLRAQIHGSGEDQTERLRARRPYARGHGQGQVGGRKDSIRTIEAGLGERIGSGNPGESGRRA